MDGSFIPSLEPSGQEVPLAIPRYFLPYEYHPHVVGGIQPSATSFAVQGKGTKKYKGSPEEGEQPRNRWRAHKKETCLCAVCKQVRGELSSTWFKHDKANCKCSVCKQARGEKRSQKKVASVEPKSKPSSISNRVRRLAGKLIDSTTLRSPVVSEQNILLASSSSKSANLPCEELSVQSSNLILAAPSNQSYLDGARVNWIWGPRTSGSDSGLPKQNLTNMKDTSTSDKVGDSTILVGAQHPTSEGFSEKISNLSSSLPSSQLNSDRLIFSWRCQSSCAMSKSESLCQSSSQALGTVSFSNWADLTALSRTAHTSFSDSAVGSSSLTPVVPSSGLHMDGTKMGLSSTASASERKSGIFYQLTPDIMDMLKESKLAHSIFVSEGTRRYSEESLMESRSRTSIVSGSELDMERIRSGSSSGPSIAESNKALPCMLDMQASEYTNVSTSKDLALPFVPNVLRITLPGPSTVNSRKRNQAYTQGETCDCNCCKGSTTFLELLCSSKITHPQCISPALKRRRIFSLSMDRKKEATLDGVGLVSSEYSLGSQCDEVITKISLQSPLVVQHDTNGSLHSPTRCDQSSCGSGRWSSLTISSSKYDLSSQLQIASFSRCGQVVLPSPHTSGVCAASSVMFFSDQAGQKPPRTLEAGVRVACRNLLRIMEPAGGILPENLKGRKWGGCGGCSAFDSYDHRRFTNQGQPSILEMPSQKLADIRIHRSQSALLLGEQPCSLLRVAHVDLPCNRDPFTLTQKESLSSHCLVQTVESVKFLADKKKLPPLCSFHLRIEGSLGGHQARPFHDILIQIHSQDTGNGLLNPTVWKLAALPYTVPRFLLNPICTLSLYGSCSSLSIRRRENVRSSCPKAAVEDMDFSGDTRVMSSENSLPLRAGGFTSLARNGVMMQQQTKRDKRKHADLGSNGAGQIYRKQRRFSCSDTQPSAVSPAICWWAPEIPCGRSASAIDGSSKHGVLQFSVSKSVGELFNNCHGNLPSYDGKILLIEAEKFKDDLSRQLEQEDEDNMDFKGVFSAATQRSDPPFQMRTKPWISDGVRQTAQFQQIRKRGEGTSCRDLHSALSSGLSFQELLNSVSQSFALSSQRASSTGESVSIHSRSCTNGKCGRCIPSEAQVLQSATGRENISCNYGEIPRLQDAIENNHEERNLTGDISNLPDVPPSKRMEDTRPHSVGYFDEYNSKGVHHMTIIEVEEGDLVEVVNSSRVQESLSQDETLLITENTGRRSHPEKGLVSFLERATPSPPRNLPCKQDKISPLDNNFTDTQDLVTTKFSMSKQVDFDEVEVLQMNTLGTVEKTGFQQKLNVVLEKPFDKLELEELEKYVSARKPQMRLRESRHETRHVPLTKEGFSYLEHYPDFRRKLESANVPKDQLKLLRGFFFWIQHTCMSGAFMPWEEEEDDDDCVQIIEENCTAVKRSSSQISDQTKGLKGLGWLRGATKSRESRPLSSMHMSLRARKKTAPTGKPLRTKRTAKQLAATKVKAEGNDHTSRKIFKEMSATCLVTAKQRTNLGKEKK